MQAIKLDRQSVAPAVLAAVGEAAVLFLPLKALAVDGVDATGGPLRDYPLFLALFVGAVALSTALRRFKAVPSIVAVAAVAVGVVQSVAWGSGTVFGMVMGVILALLLGLRVVTLALRDWRDPIRFSFGVGAGALLVEVVIAAGGTVGWRRLLPALIAQFFFGLLASRAASVRLSTPRPADDAGQREPRRWLKATVVVVACLGLLMAAAARLGRQGGGLQWVVQGVFRLWGEAIGLLAWALAKILLRPLNWVVTTLHLNLDPLNRAAQNLEGFRRNGLHRPGRASALNRFLGLLFFVLIGFLLFRTLRRRREMIERFRPSEAHEPEANATPYAFLRARRQRRRSGPELPADTVRRWYAQALLALQRLGLTKPASGTPAEYLRDVIAILPDCAAEFTVLTRAYEDVRYGNRRFDVSAIERLEPHRVLLMETFGRSPKPVVEGD